MPALQSLHAGSGYPRAGFPFLSHQALWLLYAQERVLAQQLPWPQTAFLQVGWGLGHTWSLRGPGRTCARHVQGIQVSPVIAVAADTVDGPFRSSPAVDGTVGTGLVSLIGLEGS
jgi:hypothetical protein